MYFELNERKTQHIKIHGVQLQQKTDGNLEHQIFILQKIFILQNIKRERVQIKLKLNRRKGIVKVRTESSEIKTKKQ